MEHKELLKRSSKGLWTQIISSGIGAFLLGVLITWLSSVVFKFADNGGKYIAIVTWVVLLGGWSIGAIKLWLDWNIKRYEVAEDALILHTKAGKFGTAQTIYRYESIISVRMTQGFFGKMFGYGDVEISIPKIEQPVVMNDIEDPLNQMLAIQKRMEQRNTGATHALIN